MTVNPPSSPTQQVIYPALSYRDARAAIEWLERAFGFESVMQVDGPDGKIAHAELSYNGGVVMLGTTTEGQGALDARALPPVNQGLYVYVEDPDVHCERARSAGADILRDPEDTPYGSREYSARDLEGHPWSFGTYRPRV
jgi:uncharacterized glyoxalase superfamily protein PhnB